MREFKYYFLKKVYQKPLATATQCVLFSYIAINECFTHRHTNKKSIKQRSTSNDILRLDKKRSNECIEKQSK